MNPKNIVLNLVFLFFVVSLFSQTDSGWQWAKRGGGPGDFNHSPFWSYSYERIMDLAVDSDDNYYFLAEISGNQHSELVDYDGQPLSTYNDSDDDRDIYVFSTDNAGNFRWDKMIGGYNNETANSINVDAQDNVYVSGTVWPSTSHSTHFDQDTVIPPPNDPYEVSDKAKGAFLIKYDQDGTYQWLQQPEGSHPLISDYMSDIFWYVFGSMAKTVIDPDGTSHNLIFFPNGTHLNGQFQVDVPAGKSQAAVVNYDSSGNLESFFEIDMKPLKGKVYNYQLAYNPDLDRYYIGDGIRDFNDTLSINGYGADTGPDDKAFYLAAVDNQGEVLWYHQNHNSAQFYPLGDLKLDGNGNIYLSGMFSVDSPNNEDNFAGYEFTMDKPVSSGAISPFLIKLDSEGNLLWGSNPTASYSPFPGESIVIDGDDVYLGLGILGNEWSGIDVPGPSGAGLVPDPTIMKFNAQTGDALNVISMPEVSNYNDRFMALGVDSEHNLIAGGFFGNHLFYDEPFAISNSGGPSDFFIAKYNTETGENPCAAPTDLTVDNIEAESVQVTWSPGGEESQWEVVYGNPGFDPETEGSSQTVDVPEVTLEDLEPEAYYVVYVRALCEENSQSDWSASVSFTTEDLSVEDQQIKGLKLYPNPTTGILHITAKTSLEKYRLYDLRGRVLKKGSLKTEGIDLSGFEQGLYILSVTDTKGNTQRVKVVKE